MQFAVTAPEFVDLIKEMVSADPAVAPETEDSPLQFGGSTGCSEYDSPCWASESVRHFLLKTRDHHETVANSLAHVNDSVAKCRHGFSMARYFFHVDNGELSVDREGTEFTTADKAQEAAVLASAEALRDKPRFWDTSPIWRMYVTDELDQLVLSLSFMAKEPSGPLFLRAGK